MPWCPRCDETFPEGPACPRCNARLVARERESTEDTLLTVPGLRAIKVSRRYRKALERLSGPKESSSRLLALALVLLVFATGFLLGRVGSSPTNDSPAVHALPLAEPIPYEDVKGAVAYLLSSRDRVATIAQHDLYSGDVVPTARFSQAVNTDEHVSTRMVSFGRSVAVLVSYGSRRFVAFAPNGRAPQGWIPAADVAWFSETALLVRGTDGTLVRWTSDTDSVATKKLGHADEVLQTASGPVVRRGRTLETVDGPHRSLTLPATGEVLAVSPDITRAVLDPAHPVFWDGHKKTEVHAYAGRVLGASFEPSGERAAMLLADGGELTLAVVVGRGAAALKPLGSGSGCSTAPAWDSAGRWIYVATGDGLLHAVEANGGRIEAIKTHGVGCGLAWLDVA